MMLPTYERRLRSAIMLTVLCIAAGLPIKPPLKFELPKDGDPLLDFNSRYGVVLVGDSRVRDGLDVTAMEARLPGCKVAKLAFGGLGFSSDILEVAGSKLAAGKGASAIVFGVTPHSLTQGAVNANGYRDLLKSPIHVRLLNRFVRTHFGSAALAFQPLNLMAVRLRLTSLRARSPVAGTIQAGDRREGALPGKPRTDIALESLSEEKTLDEYRGLFRESTYSPAVAHDFLDRVRTLTQKGVVVYGFRPPVSTRMRALEDSMSGFDQVDFEQEFRRHGGRWLSLPGRSYTTSDGSHLDRESSVRFSRDLAAALRPSLPGYDGAKQRP